MEDRHVLFRNKNISGIERGYCPGRMEALLGQEMGLPDHDQNTASYLYVFVEWNIIN
jgi:hypothetical protein